MVRHAPGPKGWAGVRHQFWTPYVGMVSKVTGDARLAVTASREEIERDIHPVEQTWRK